MFKQIKELSKKLTLKIYGSGLFKEEVYDPEYQALFELSKETGRNISELVDDVGEE
ncbi:hypothetical protein SAMN02745116_00696 [Pilibacter termitis]|uniref:Uncharacterized protein n=1 Tax=Pilibacter termitis TaxID=263852 RepID=A0A1T4LKG6_9ENTE|nr:hypothetical protein [Pilibacter termitis]SJZ55116.1 hypothetical protein SAMN02745116_00696 [Pilibacter termitis]